MSELPATSIDQPAALEPRLGPGRLVLVVGPSGAGKDTLLDRVRVICAQDDRVVFPRRVVTRQASAFEDNQEISEPAFREALQHGRFAIHWEAHGHCYALPGTINDDIRAGRTVIANVSRTVIPALRLAYADVVVVVITAPAEVLAERLAARGRGSDGDIGARLRRAVNQDEALADITIVNVGDPDAHARHLAQIVTAANGANP